MTTDKREPPSPSTDTPEEDYRQPPTTPSLPPLGSVKLKPGAQITAVTLPSGKRYEWDDQGKETVFNPQ